LSPAFDGSLETQKHFLDQVGIIFTEEWTFADTECAYRAWNAYVRARRTSDTPKRPLADLLVGAFACRYQGLITLGYQTLGRSVIVLPTRSTVMTQMEARDLVKRIQILPDAEQIKILSRVMQAEGKKVAWSKVEAIQRRMSNLAVDDEKLTREIVEAVREVRRERQRKSRS
jgi:hypothetical protein